RVDRPQSIRGGMVRRGLAIADNAQGADLRTHRGARRGADDVAAGVSGRDEELGLPLLLAARCDAHLARADERRLLRRGAGVARLAPACGRRIALTAPDHVRPCRRTASAGIRGAVVAWI